VLNLVLSIHGNTYDLSNEFLLEKEANLEQEKAKMVYLLTGDLVLFDETVGTNTALVVNNKPGEAIEIWVYSDNSYQELLGKAKTEIMVEEA
jgi:hypothetical protein